MAQLTFCKDCGKAISKKAKSCPNCGAPNKKKSGCIALFLWLFVVLPIIAVLYTLMADFSDPSQELFNKQQLNVRSGAGVDNSIIGVLEPGSLVTINGKNMSGWVEIRYNGGFFGKSFSGWVNRNYVYPESEYSKWKSNYDEEQSRQRAISNKDAWKTTDSKSMAYLMCEDWVKQRLKSPGSAEFPGVFDGKFDNLVQTNQRYSIRSYVDSQNSFGAMLRSNFHCVTTQISDGNWELNRLDIE